MEKQASVTGRTFGAVFQSLFLVYLVASGDVTRADIDPLRDKILTDSILKSQNVSLKHCHGPLENSALSRQLQPGGQCSILTVVLTFPVLVDFCDLINLVLARGSR